MHSIEAGLVDRDRLVGALETADYLVEVQYELGESRRRAEWMVDEIDGWDQLLTPESVSHPQELIEIVQANSSAFSEG
jgi:hypothetical protein